MLQYGLSLPLSLLSSLPGKEEKQHSLSTIIEQKRKVES